MPEPQQEPEIKSGTGYATTLELVAYKLIEAGCTLAGPTGIALDRNGCLDPDKPWCWILAETRASQPPPRPTIATLVQLVLPAPPPRRRQRIVRLFIRNERSVILDIHQKTVFDQKIRSILRILTGSLNIRFEFEESEIVGQPLFEVFPDDPPASLGKR
jgi:hypothetical protein